MTVKSVIQREIRVAIPRIKYLLLLVVLALASCDGAVYHSFQQVNSKLWSQNDTLSFVYEGVGKHGDEALLKMAAQVRYNSEYKYKVLSMRIETLRLADSTLLSVDTLCLHMFDDTGRRLGSISGALYQNGSNDVYVNASPMDTLLLRLSHIMADNSLCGVCDVGIRLISEKK